MLPGANVLVMKHTSGILLRAPAFSELVSALLVRVNARSDICRRVDHAGCLTNFYDTEIQRKVRWVSKSVTRDKTNKGESQIVLQFIGCVHTRAFLSRRAERRTESLRVLCAVPFNSSLRSRSCCSLHEVQTEQIWRWEYPRPRSNRRHNSSNFHREICMNSNEF